MAIIDRIKYDGNSNGSQWLIYPFGPPLTNA